MRLEREREKPVKRVRMSRVTPWAVGAHPLGPPEVLLEGQSLNQRVGLGWKPVRNTHPQVPTPDLLTGNPGGGTQQSTLFKPPR